MNETIDKPGYYAIIPANVRYDKDLTPLSRLFYGEITCLCNKYGYCVAGNQYFAELYGISAMSVKRIVRQLESKEYITVERENNSRKIYISPENRVSKMLPQSIKNVTLMGNKNVTHNNTSINNKYNNTCSEQKSSEPPQVILQLPLKDGTLFNITDELIKYYSDLYPGVDILSELKKMNDWLTNYPNRRKKQIKRFISNWLSHCGQNKSSEPEYRFNSASDDKEFLKRLEDCNGYY